MNFWKKMTLRTRTIAIIAGMSLTYFMVGLVLQQRMVGLWTKNELDSFKSNNATISAAIAAQFYERYGDIQAIASNGNLLSKDQAVRVGTLNTYIKLYGIYDMFLFTDTKGNVISASTVDASGKEIEASKIISKNYSSSAWFKNSLAGSFTEDKEKGFFGTFVEDAHLDPISTEVYGQKMLGNSFSTLVKDPSGEVVGVITARANFKWVENEVSLAYEKLKAQGQNQVEILILNKDEVKLVDLQPSHYNSKTGYERNFDIVLKESVNNYSEENLKKIHRGEALIAFDINKSDKTNDLISFGAINSSKFISSIGWHTLFVTEEDEILGTVIRARNMFLSVFFLIGLVGTLGGFFFARGLSARLTSVSEKISTEADLVTTSSKKVSAAASNLASSTHEQAAAVQETVSAIDEVSAMVAKSADNAKESLSVAIASKGIAEKGKSVIDAMLVSMSEIQNSNLSIMNQVDASNQQFSSIVKLINEIGQKTKVINDIVFQTKLLSFNASVEAARAGEHGKGFAVVAEEVGNLAQMSGNAAKEITQMLESSIQQVEKIASESKSKISGLMAENKEKVEKGSSNAKQSAQILVEIVENVNKVGAMATEIANASKEQSQGVVEISKAMNQLGVVSQENASASQESSSASIQLLEQADELRAVVQDLNAEVYGAQFMKYSSSDEGKSNPTDKPKSSSDTKPGKILEFKTQKKAAMPVEEIKVVGGTSIPLSDDSRFEDV